MCTALQILKLVQEDEHRRRTPYRQPGAPPAVLRHSSSCGVDAVTRAIMGAPSHTSKRYALLITLEWYEIPISFFVLEQT